MQKILALDQNDILLAAVFRFLWWDDVYNFMLVCRRSLTSMRSPIVGEALLADYLVKVFRLEQIIKYPEQLLLSTLEGQEDYWLLLARRISSYPTRADVASLTQEERNIAAIPSPTLSPEIPWFMESCCVYGGRKKGSHKGCAVIATDDHFPCLPGAFTQPRHKSEGKLQAWERLPLVELQKKKKEGVVTRVMAPFTRILNTGSEKVLAYLSCVAYFEVNVLFNRGYSAMDDIRRFSIGIACSLFPLRKKQLGYDQYSFGYHREGSLVHNNRKFAQMPPYNPGDTVGCGLVYPPLTNEPKAKIFFTKNGELVGFFDMGMESLLSLPWFPAQGLAPSIPMEFNFGLLRSFKFNVLDFEAEVLSKNFEGTGWEYYLSVVAEQEMNLYPNKYIGHPIFKYPHIAPKAPPWPQQHIIPGRLTANNLKEKNMAGLGLPNGHIYAMSENKSVIMSPGGSNRNGNPVQGPTPLGADLKSPVGAGASVIIEADSIIGHENSIKNSFSSAASSGGTASARIKCIPSRYHSLYLNPDIRAATWLGINDTKRVTFQGSDASWEGSAEGDGDDLEDSDLEVNSDSARDGGGTGNNNLPAGAVPAPFVMDTEDGTEIPMTVPMESISDLYPGVSQPTGLRSGSGAIERGDQNPSKNNQTIHGLNVIVGLKHLTGRYTSSNASGSISGDSSLTHKSRKETLSPAQSLIRLRSGESSNRAHGSNEKNNLLSKGGKPLPVGTEMGPAITVRHFSSHFDASPLHLGSPGSGEGGNGQKEPGVGIGFCPGLACGVRTYERTESLGSQSHKSLQLSDHGDEGDDDESNDEASIANSLCVEVPSVDEQGSYIGYGAETPSESDMDDGEGDSIIAGGRASSHSDFDGSSYNREGKRSPLWGSGFGDGSQSSVDGSVFSSSRNHSRNTSLSLSGGALTMNDMSVDSNIKKRDPCVSLSMRLNVHTHDHDADGYDGASERGGDIGTDIDNYDELSQSGPFQEDTPLGFTSNDGIASREREEGDSGQRNTLKRGLHYHNELIYQSPFNGGPGSSENSQSSRISSSTFPEVMQVQTKFPALSSGSGSTSTSIVVSKKRRMN